MIRTHQFLAGSALALATSLSGAAAAPLPPPRPSELVAKPAAVGAPGEPEIAAAPDVVPPAPMAQAPVPPLPPRRPARLDAPARAAEPEAEPPPDGAPKSAEADPCLARLDAMGVDYAKLPAAGAGGCRVERPLRVMSLAGGVALTPPAIMVCPMAEALALWAARDVAAAAKAHALAPLTRLEIGGSYECRGVNRSRSGRLSEHGRANAADIMAFWFGPNRSIRITTARDGQDARFVASVRESACGRFGTVLGPGSDPFHYDHLHFDAKFRRIGAVCR